MAASDDRIGPYRVDEELGEGAMGVVYRAAHDDGTVVALKVLRDELASDATFRQRFEHEARAAREVEHRSLVPILDAGEADGHVFLAVAYIDGQTLEERIADSGPLPVRDTVRIVRRIAGGLDALHAKDIVHRDVKPSNVLLDTEGQAFLTDFGLAKGPAWTVLTRPGEAMGTPDYMAPELILGQEPTPATDIYALGCLTVECLTGEPPFAKHDLLRIASAHIEEPPPDPADLRPDITPDLSWAALRALEKNPADRPPTARTYAELMRAGTAR